MLFEAQWLRLRRLSVALPGLPPTLDGLKILHISDLHAGVPGPNEMVMSKLNRIAAGASADIVLFTGDMTNKKRDIKPYLPLLDGIEARYGKYAVLGNHDHGLRKSVIEDFLNRMPSCKISLMMKSVDDESLDETVAANRSLLAEAGIQLLENECVKIQAGAEEVQVCGVDDFQYGFADIEGTAGQVDHGVPLRILLSHSPDAADHISNGDYHLLLAGHTHGGQICLPRPSGGKILLSTSGSSYGTGLYHVGDTFMHVSPGAGTTLLPFRLLRRPEVTLLELTTG